MEWFFLWINNFILSDTMLGQPIASPNILACCLESSGLLEHLPLLCNYHVYHMLKVIYPYYNFYLFVFLALIIKQILHSTSLHLSGHLILLKMVVLSSVTVIFLVYQKSILNISTFIHWFNKYLLSTCYIPHTH